MVMKTKSYSEILLDAFLILYYRGLVNLPDPDNRVGFIAPISGKGDPKKVNQALEQAIGLAIKARGAELSGDIDRALGYWRTLFNHQLA